MKVNIDAIMSKLDLLAHHAQKSGDAKDLSVYQFGCAWHWPAISQWIKEQKAKETP